MLYHSYNMSNLDGSDSEDEVVNTMHEETHESSSSCTGQDSIYDDSENDSDRQDNDTYLRHIVTDECGKLSFDEDSHEERARLYTCPDEGSSDDDSENDSDQQDNDTNLRHMVSNECGNLSFDEDSHEERARLYTCPDEGSSHDDNEEHFDQQKIFIGTEYNIKGKEEDLNCNDPKPDKRKYDSASNSEERCSKRPKNDKSENSINSFKDKKCLLPEPKQLNTTKPSNISDGEDTIKRILRSIEFKVGDA